MRVLLRDEVAAERGRHKANGGDDGVSERRCGHRRTKRLDGTNSAHDRTLERDERATHQSHTNNGRLHPIGQFREHVQRRTQ